MNDEHQLLFSNRFYTRIIINILWEDFKFYLTYLYTCKIFQMIFVLILINYYYVIVICLISIRLKTLYMADALCTILETIVLHFFIALYNVI